MFYRIRAYRTLQLLLLLLHVATGWVANREGWGHANAGVYGLLSLLPIGSRKSENCQAIFNLICGAAQRHRVHRVLKLILNNQNVNFTLNLSFIESYYLLCIFSFMYLFTTDLLAHPVYFKLHSNGVINLSLPLGIA